MGGFEISENYRYALLNTDKKNRHTQFPHMALLAEHLRDRFLDLPIISAAGLNFSLISAVFKIRNQLGGSEKVQREKQRKI